MKTSYLLSLVPGRKLIGFISIAILLPLLSNAQLPVTAISSHKTNATTSVTYAGTGATGSSSSGFAGNSYTYKYGTAVQPTNNNDIIDSFTAGGVVFRFEPAVINVKFRRVNSVFVTGSRKSLRMEQTGGTVNPGGTAQLLPDYNDSLEQLFTQRTINIGIDNLFQNDSGTNNNNIERLDVIFPYGFKVTDSSKAGFAVFEWGAVGSHDPFVIAAIKTLDASHNPLTYYTADSVGPSSYGSGVIGTANYLVLRENPGESRMLMEGNGTSQDRDGVLLRFKDLSVPTNTFVYGYSIFAPDTKRTPASNLVDYTNATNFPNNTDFGISGGIDPLAVTGLWVANPSYILLPDRVSALQSVVVNDQVKLDWELYNASDVTEQVVEKSSDGMNFTPMQEVAIQVTPQQTVWDTRPVNGKNYYRLKLLSQDGSAVYSSISWADMKSTSGLVMDVYPNPVKNSLVNLDFSGLTNNAYTLLLLDINGRTLLRQPITGQQALHTSLSLPGHLPGGAYLLQLVDQCSHNVVERRLIIQ